MSLADKIYRGIFANPKHFPAVYLLSSLLLQTNSAAEAELALRCAADLNPSSPEVQNNLGLALARQGKLAEALRHYDRALALKPAYPAALLNKGNALRQRGDTEGALALYDQALALEDGADLHFNRGAALEALGRLEDAKAAYATALRLKPQFPDALNNLGNAVAAAGEPQKGLALLDQAIAQNPASAMPYVNRGAVLSQLRRFPEAREALEQALALNPGLTEAWCNRGNIARETGDIDGAMADYARALALKPGDRQALWNRGMTRLLLGDWSQGWADYELRHVRRPVPDFAMPEWRGEVLGGRSILLCSEQGLGDAIQFSRFAGALRERGAAVTLLAPAGLARLLDQLEGVRVVGEVAPDEHFDRWAPLMSLPRYLGFTPQQMPAAPMPYLRAEQARTATWAARLGNQGRRIGICWQGNPAGCIDSGRSIPLRKFAPLAAVPGVRLISLQKGPGLEQLESAGLPVEAFPEMDAGPDGFLDTAAIIAHLDLVITSDTSVAHLAAAMGKPVWLALKLVPDWRWLLGRADTPWYPSMRLHRQARLDDWDGVFERMAADLAA